MARSTQQKRGLYLLGGAGVLAFVLAIATIVSLVSSSSGGGSLTAAGSGGPTAAAPGSTAAASPPATRPPTPRASQPAPTPPGAPSPVDPGVRDSASGSGWDDTGDGPADGGDGRPGGGSGDTPTSPATPTPPPASPTPPPDDSTLPPGSTRSIFDGDGNLAMPMPSLLHETAVERSADGSAVVTFGFGFDVANQQSRAGVRQDSAVIHVMVSDTLSAGGGPLRSQTPVFSQTLVESRLDAAHVERDYRVRLPADVVSFLDTRGFASPDPSIRRAALVYVDLDVQVMRDFKVVDGEWDWQQGRAWTAADLPVQVADNTDSSSITVTNDTAAGVYRTNLAVVPDVNWIEGAVDVDATSATLSMNSDLLESTDAYAAPISLSGQSVQCIAQGNGSNPQGFALMNGWDIEQGLAPGTVPPGASVTETVVADDSLGAPTEDIIEDTGTATVQTTAAALNYTTPGAKSATQYTYMLALGLDTVSDGATVALGIPIKAIVELGIAIADAANDSCADFANIFNLTAVEPSGAQSSVSWADQTDGLFSVYDSASNSGTPVTDSVQLSRSTGTMTGVVDGNAYAVNPYLSQYPTTACGDARSCSGNEITLRWSATNPCPQLNSGDCLPDAADIASPQLTVPGTSLCGVDNELCPVVAAPISSASDVPAQADLAGTEGSPYSVLMQKNVSETTTGLATDDAGNVYTGTGSGTFQVTTPLGVSTPILDLASGISTMTSVDGLIYAAVDDGELIVYDPADGFSYPSVISSDAHITSMAATGGGTMYYVDSDDNLVFYPPFDADDPDQGAGDLVAPASRWPQFDGNLAGQSITSMTSDGTYLFFGFGNGYVMKCTLTDCGASLELWVDPFALPDYEGNGDLSSFGADALTLVGDSLYLGGSDGSLYQVDALSGAVSTIQTVGSDSAAVAGLAVADGALYVGGCFGIESPITGELVGVFTLPVIDGENSTYAAPIGANENYFDSCINPSSTTSHFKGFDAADYQLVVSKPDPTLPAIVYVAYSIDGTSSIVALQNTSLPSVGVCTGNCPADTQPSYYDTDTTTSPSPRVTSLAALGAPAIENSCGSTGQPAGSSYATTATGPFGTAGPAGITIDDGFQLTAAGSSTRACTTQFSWSLNDVGTLPYGYWAAMAYPDSITAPSTPVAFGASGAWNYSTVTVPGSIDENGTIITAAYPWWVFAPGFLTTSAAEILTPYADPLIATPPTLESPPVLAAPPSTAVGEDGAPIVVSLGDSTMLVLTITVPAGSDPVVLDLAEDTLTGTGTPPTPPATPAACAPFDLALAGSDAAVYPLDDTIPIALDITGDGHNGTIYSPGPQNVPTGPAVGCPAAGSLTFDAGATRVDTGPGTSDLVDGAELTVMAWFQAPGGPVGGTPRLIANAHTDETWAGFQLALNGSGDGVSSGFFDVGTGTALGTANWQTTSPLVAGQWYQLVGVYDGSTVAVYLDGVLMGTGSAAGPVQPGTDDVQIGFDPAYDSDFFGGQMADVMLSSTALSAADVAAIYEQVTGTAAAGG